MKATIKALSFLYKNERIVVKVSKTGKFRVPVTETHKGSIRTKMRYLSARQVVEHEIIKNCDPTIYLDRGEKLRVFQGGDPSYLPAYTDGVISKHDESFIPKIKSENKKNSILDKPLTSRGDIYSSIGLDMYGWWPDDEYGN